MATVTIAGEDRRIADPGGVRKFLAPFGICYENWEVAGRSE